MLTRSSKYAGIFLSGVIIFCIFLFICGNARAETDFITSGKLLAGNIYLKAGSITDALREFETAYQKDPSNPDVLIGLVRCYAHIGEFEKASNKLSELENKRKGDMRVNLVKAEVLSLKGHVEEASNEFIMLIGKGIYRFEALQGLIHLYAESPDTSMKRVIDETVSLYEPVNQITLYSLLVENLEGRGNKKEAKEYRDKLDFLRKMELQEGDEAVYSDVNPLDWAISRAEDLLDEGSLTEAMCFLEEASLRWPGEYRIQNLLKSCYREKIQEVPVTRDNTSAISAVGASNLISKVGLDNSPYMAYVPLDLPLNAEETAYLTKVFEITNQTQEYYIKMVNNVIALKGRIDTDIATYGPDRCDALQRDLDELYLIIDEATKVSKQEESVLKQAYIPKGLEEFNSIILKAASIRTQMFDNVKLFATQRQMSYLEKAVENAKEFDELLHQLSPTLMKICEGRTVTASDKKGKDKTKTEPVKPV